MPPSQMVMLLWRTDSIPVFALSRLLATVNESGRPARSRSQTFHEQRRSIAERTAMSNPTAALEKEAQDARSRVPRLLAGLGTRLPLRDGADLT
jgi:hypothetical protein